MKNMENTDINTAVEEETPEEMQERGLCRMEDVLGVKINRDPHTALVYRFEAYKNGESIEAASFGAAIRGLGCHYGYARFDSFEELARYLVGHENGIKTIKNHEQDYESFDSFDGKTRNTIVKNPLSEKQLAKLRKMLNKKGKKPTLFERVRDFFW